MPFQTKFTYLSVEISAVTAVAFSLISLDLSRNSGKVTAGSSSIEYGSWLYK